MIWMTHCNYSTIRYWLGCIKSFFVVNPFSQDNWRGIPTRLNNIPHSREIREYFYEDVLQATQRAVQDKRFRLKVRCVHFFLWVRKLFKSFLILLVDSVRFMTIIQSWIDCGNVSNGYVFLSFNKILMWLHLSSFL